MTDRGVVLPVAESREYAYALLPKDRFELLQES